MSTILITRPRRVALPLGALMAAAMFSAVSPSIGQAQQPLGVPFIGNNHLAFYSTERSKDGVGSSVTATFGGLYARQFGGESRLVRPSLMVRANARPLADTAGVLDFAATLAMTHQVAAIDGLSVSAAAGAGTLIWGDEATNDGRIGVTVPLTLGVGYDLHIGGATLAPFVAPAIVRYSLRTYENDARVATERGWDTQFTSGASLRFKEVVLSTSRIRGEKGSPNSSRWTFAAGMSF